MRLGIIMLFTVLFSSIKAQENLKPGRLITHNPIYLQVGNITTTVIVFPSAVKEADRGISSLLASKVPGVENAIKIKASSPFTDTTSLHVFTADGHVQVFKVTFNPFPPITTYIWSPNNQGAYGHPIQFNNVPYNEYDFEKMADSIRKRKPFLSKRTKKHKLQLRLQGLYYNEEVIIAKLKIINSAPLSYKAGWVQLYLADRVKNKRTSVQHVNIPYYYHDSLPFVPGFGEKEWILIFPKITLMNNKKLLMELNEKNGGRNLVLEIFNRHLLKANPL